MALVRLLDLLVKKNKIIKAIANLEMLFAQEILSLNSKCIPLIYKLVEGKFKIGFNKRTNLYYYHIDGIAVEEFKNKPTVIGINKRIFVKANV